MQFQKGQSGNPAGRPFGSRNKATVLMEGLLEGEGEAIARKAIEMAKGGDMAAIRMCMDRLAPGGEAPRSPASCRRSRRAAAPPRPWPRSSRRSLLATGRRPRPASLARVIGRYMFARSLAEFEHRRPAGLAAT